jgi:hypothetical protein
MSSCHYSHEFDDPPRSPLVQVPNITSSRRACILLQLLCPSVVIEEDACVWLDRVDRQFFPCDCYGSDNPILSPQFWTLLSCV